MLVHLPASSINSPNLIVAFMPQFWRANKIKKISTLFRQVSQSVNPEGNILHYYC
jgi:hypothetical protein